LKFHYIVRGIVIVDGKVLLAHSTGASNTFLPGGHIDTGEGAESALVREIHEEIGKRAIVKRFVGAVESVWSEDGLDNHEINLVFEVDIPELDSAKPLQSLEGHLEFIWVEPSALEMHNLQPDSLIECLTNWKTSWSGYWGTSLS